MASDSSSAVGGSTQDWWQIWVDTGGTFTDCLALDPAGEARRTKVLSSGRLRAVAAGMPARHRVAINTGWNLPDAFFSGCELRCLDEPGPRWSILDYQARERCLLVGPEVPAAIESGATLEIDAGVEAPTLAAHWVTGTPLDRALPPCSMRLATTRGTNALLERSGSTTVLFITRGFGDLLAIGNQQRPELFTLDVVKVAPLHERVVEVDERLDSSGEVLQPLNLEALRPEAERLVEAGVEVAAVALMHSYRNSAHERELAAFLLDLGFRHVSCSSILAPRIKIVPRAETAVINAYLSGVISRYLESVGESVGPGPLHVLTSAGSLVRAQDYLPKDSLLSGPAGGVVGAAAMASQSGWPRSLAFDMGGTSTDVSRFDGELDYRFETRVGDARLLSPSLAIETVAAGGGSICYFDGRQLKVGPQSAGADPGPACYGAGGPLTLTDVNLLLGRLRPESFEIPIDPTAAERALRKMVEGWPVGETLTIGEEEILQGLLDIANERMAEAVRRISIRQGYLPGDYALVAFGGAGGQHACALAEILGMDTVLVPADAGLLSAVGLGRARVERIAERQVLRPLQEMQSELDEIVGGLGRAAFEAVLAEGVEADQVAVERQLAFLRLVGQEASLGVSYTDIGRLAEDFAAAYEDHYGYRPGDSPVEVESVRVIATSGGATNRAPREAVARRTVEATERREALMDVSWQPVPVFERRALAPGDRFLGPALVFESHCATVLPSGWSGCLDEYGCLVLTRLQRGGTRELGNES